MLNMLLLLRLPPPGLGAAPPPKTDLHRFVKWPKYVRLQRQKRVLQMRLKVPPVVNQFMTKALDKNHAETLFKLLLKYRPEDKKQKRDRCGAVQAGGGGAARRHASAMRQALHSSPACMATPAG